MPAAGPGPRLRTLRFIKLLTILACLLAFPAGFAAATTSRAPSKKKPVITQKKTTTAAAKTTTTAVTTTTVAPLPPANDASWLSFGHDDQITKQVVSSLITSSTVANLKPRWTFKLGGTIVAQPLYYNGTVYAASEAGDIVAVNAQTGKQIWRQTTSTVATPSCGTWGISSTPVIDTLRNRIYFASASGQINALDLTTGGRQPGFPVNVVRSSAMEYIWGALRLFGNSVLAGVSSHCDEPNASGAYATGKLAAINVVDSPGAQTAVFQPVTGTGHLGGIWGYGGAAITPNGQAIYVGTGNAIGTDPACKCQHDDWGYGDAMVQLSPSLAVTASSNPAIPKSGDDDWGAAPALFQPNGCQPLAVASNKDGVVYVYNQSGISAGPIWTLAVGDGQAPLLDGPAWSPVENMFYISGARMPYDRNQPRSGEGIVAVKVAAGCKFSVAWTAPTGDGPQAPPIVVGNVVFASGGNHDVVALDALTGKELWHDHTSGSTLGSPSEAAGTLFATDGSNLVAFGP
jgi:outer membrane protein assembly factor BamB